MIAIAFDNSYSRLPDSFFARVSPRNVSAPRLIAFNRGLAEELGLDPDALEPVAARLFSGNETPPGADPIALAYAGHQFGQFVPQLGDGRALLLGEVMDRHGNRRDIQLKGSGPTPFSRRGDGNAALGPVLREYIVSEAMHALGIPTTRALAAVATGETVYRETALPGAVLTRVAASHIRVGTFQYFAARRDEAALRTLADHVIARHYPELAQSERPYLALLVAVAERQAALVAAWMRVGFIHGVMNTDNTAISGETIDYGPCAFMDAYDPAAVFSAIDQGGRYAFARQAGIAQWNLARFAETLLVLIDPVIEDAISAATSALEAFPARFDHHWMHAMRAKIGLVKQESDDRALIGDLLHTMQTEDLDFTVTFRGLSAELSSPSGRLPASLPSWLPRWRARLEREARSPAEISEGMNAVNPAIIPRNHRIEAMIAAAVERGDYGPFARMLDAVSQPFADRPTFADFTTPPTPAERVCQTFCGT